MLVSFATSEAAVHVAGRTAESGDAIGTQRYLTDAAKYADLAYARAKATAPDDATWASIQSDMMNAARAYKTGIDKMKDAMDSGSSEETASAMDDADSAAQTVGSATHNARTWYAAHGGKAADLYDLDSLAKAMNGAADTLTGNQ